MADLDQLASASLSLRSSIATSSSTSWPRRG